MKKLYALGIVLSAILFQTNTNAQSRFAFYNLGDYVPQTQNLSPVYLPKNGFTLGTPLNTNLSLSSPFKVSDFFTETNNNTLEVDFNKLYAAADDTNRFSADLTQNVFFAAFRTKKGSLTFFANAKSQSNIQFGKSVFGLLANGLDVPGIMLDNENGETILYGEVGIGYTHKFLDDKLAVAARFKYLNGLAYAGTEKDASLNLDIDENTLLWNLKASNATVNTSGLDEDDQSDIIGFGGNTGFAVDFGARYQINDKWSVNVAVNDLGSITWKEKVKNFIIEDTDGSEFNGIDLNSDVDVQDQLEDALENVLDMKETEESFKTSLAAKAYVSGIYQMDNRNQFSAAFYNNFIFDSFRPAFALGYNRTLNKTTFGAVVSSENNMVNVGLNGILKLGPLQLYAAVDNLSNAFGKIEEAQDLSFSFGLNLVFGYKKKAEKEENKKDSDAIFSSENGEYQSAE